MFNLSIGIITLLITVGVSYYGFTNTLFFEKNKFNVGAITHKKTVASHSEFGLLTRRLVAPNF